MENFNRSIKVSVIIPVYNTELYIASCIDSCLKQDYDNYEILIVNDGSVDRSGEICEMYHKRFPNIIKYISTENKGVTQARKTGVELSSGEWIMFIDSDDYIVSNYISSYVKEIECDILMICSSYCGTSKLTSQEYIRQLIKSTSLWGMPRKIYHRSLFSKITEVFYLDRYFNIGEDFIANLLLIKSSNLIKTIDFDGYISNERQDSATRSRKWSVQYEKNLIQEIKISLGVLCEDLKNELWRKELHSLRNVILFSDEPKKNIANWRKEILNSKIGIKNLSIIEHIVLYLSYCPSMLKASYKIYHKLWHGA